MFVNTINKVAKGGVGLFVLFALAAPAGAQYGESYGYSDGGPEVYDVQETDIRVEASPSQGQAQTQSVLVQPAPRYYDSTAEVKASPLINSRAQSLRKSREDLEVETEQKIVEKLEESRIDDERRRSDKLFGDRLGSLGGEAEAPRRPEPKPEPEIVYIEKEVIKEPEPVKVEEPIAQEVSLAAKYPVDNAWKGTSRSYISADLGTSDFPDILNVQGKMATGVGIGVELPNRFVVEGKFRYSAFDLEKVETDGVTSAGFRDVTQYNFGVGLNYKLLETMFTPKIGSSLNYTTRSITEDVGIVKSDTTTSNGLDLGLMAGIDVDVNEGFSLGLDFNYFSNISTRRSGESLIHPSSGSQIEDFDYYMITLSGKFFF